MNSENKKRVVKKGVENANNNSLFITYVKRNICMYFTHIQKKKGSNKKNSIYKKC